MSSSVTFTSAGSMRNGRLYERPTLVQRTGVNDSSLSRMLPTATVSDTYTGNLASSQQKPGSMHSVTLPQAVERLLPTARATDGPHGGPAQTNGRGMPDSLPAIGKMLPTPTASQSGQRSEESMQQRLAATDHNFASADLLVTIERLRRGESSDLLSDGGNEPSGVPLPLPLWTDD